MSGGGYGEGCLKMASMRVGCLVSFVGVAVALAPALYYLTLPLGSPTRAFFDTKVLGIPYILYLAILGAAITAGGLFLFIKAARSAESAITSRPVVREPVHLSRPRPVRRAVTVERRDEGQEEIVREIEREIEEIVKSGEEVEEDREPEEAVEEEELEEEAEEVIEVVTRGTDMVCPHCGALNPLGSTKCSKCKKPLFKVKKGEPTCPVCGAPLRLAKRITDELFVCGLCFSELRIPQSVQQKIRVG